MDETVPCKICGTKTKMTGTQLCDRCWELENSFRSLINTDPGKAAIWAQHAVHKATAEIKVGDDTTEDEDFIPEDMDHK